jgi:hypothetical protein
MTLDEKEVAPRACERCGDELHAIAYGYPSPEMMEAEERGEIALGGCVVYDDAPRWTCPGCGDTTGRVDSPDLGPAELPRAADPTVA